MSSYLRNLKFPAHQSYLSLKPVLFRAQSCPTIGFYSSADQVHVPNGSALTQIWHATNEQTKKRTEVGRIEVFLPIADFFCELSQKSLMKTLTCKTAGNSTDVKSALSVFQLPADSLMKLDSQVQRHSPLSGTHILSSVSAAEAYLCDQIQNNNVTVLSGFLEASPYHVFCIGADDRDRLSNAQLSEVECRAMRFADIPKPPGKPMNTSGRASEEQLHKVYTALADSLPKFFHKSHNYSIYHEEVIFENNIRGVTTRGLKAYIQQLTLTRILGRLRYAHIKLEILKMTQHPEDGTVRVRWRINIISGMRVLFMFWRFQLLQWKKGMIKENKWIDGFSIFHVGADGLVYKHICDKMMPDDNREVVKERVGSMGVKLALMLGLVPDYGYFADLEEGSLLSMLQKEQH